MYLFSCLRTKKLQFTLNNKDIIMANLIINKDTVNDLVVTVSERITLSSPFYLFVLQSKFNSTEYRYFNAVNISNNKIRYDEFLVTETTGASYSNAEVDLFTGEWDYKIYESVTKTLDPDDTTGVILENGLLIVTDENYN